MKAKKPLTVFVAMLAMNLAVPIITQAESLESLQEQESTVMQQSQQISAEVQIALNDVNQKYSEVEALKAKVADNENTLVKTKQNIEETKETIQKREAVVAERMKNLQLNGGGTKDWTILLESANIQEFINRAYAMTMLQNLEKEKIDSLSDEKEKLEELQNKAEKTQANLEGNQQSLELQAQELSTKIANLQTQLKEKQSALQQIAQSKEVEQARLEAEKAAKEKAAKEAAEAAAKEKAAAEAAAKESSQQSSNQSSSSSSSNNSSSSNGSTESSVVENSNSNNSSGNTSKPAGNGKTMIMESTAYSYSEPGSGHITANGTDLKQNPTAVAVDPSVIPLGTLLEVQGYGIAFALDTGGAIKGNIIDVHFKTVAECKQWGRRQVKVTILG